MPLTLERIEALAPDQPSLPAARKLLKPALRPTLVEGELVRKVVDNKMPGLPSRRTIDLFFPTPSYSDHN